jgi:hypothetical protein
MKVSTGFYIISGVWFVYAIVALIFNWGEVPFFGGLIIALMQQGFGSLAGYLERTRSR